MTTAHAAILLPQPVAPVPKAEIRFRLQRDGELATGRRVLRFYSDWNTLDRVCMVFQDDGDGTGLAPQVYRVPIAALLAQGEWVAVGVDDNAPRKSRAIYLALAESGTYTFDITQGAAGAGGDPATLDAVVRLNGLPADREVVVLEKPSDGQWRVAGFGTSVAGELDAELRVVGGDCYAVGMDGWGLTFAPGLVIAIGQRIRPSTFTGWLYQITEAGTLPASEPEWWAAEGDNVPRLLGTARAVAVRYYQPLAHGPVPVEII